MKYKLFKPVMIHIAAFIVHMIYLNRLFFITAYDKIKVSRTRCKFIFRIRNIMSSLMLGIIFCHFNINILILRIRRIIPAKVLKILRLFSSILRYTTKIYLFYSIVIIANNSGINFFYIAIRYRLSSCHNRKWHFI